MASKVFFFILLLLVMIMAGSTNPVLPSTSPNLSWDLNGHGSDLNPTCMGSVGQCTNQQDHEMSMESPSTDRMLYSSPGYISYGALRRDTVPCNQRGFSYYNCRRSGRANPYHRGCSSITRCARNLD